MMKLTQEILKTMIREELKESWRERYRKSSSRSREMNVGDNRSHAPSRNDKRNWNQQVKPALKGLVAADPTNELASELLANMRKITEEEYNQILSDLQTHGIFAPGFKVNASTYHMVK